MRKRIICLLLSFVYTLGFSGPDASAAELAARPFELNVEMDGTPATFWVYSIGGEDYFKLRDLAFVLNGSSKQFDVSWDAENNAVNLISGANYTIIGHEMAIGRTGATTASPARNGVLLDGEPANVSGFIIDDYFYVKLFDAARLFNFDVRRGDGEGVLINSRAEHDPDSDYAYKPPTVLAESEDMGQEYIDGMIFIGDSTTYGFLAYGVLTGGRGSKQVWTPSNRTFTLSNQNGIKILYPETGENITIEEAVAIKKPEYIIITLGINGVSYLSEEDFKKHYKAVIDRILEANPDTKLILNSIFPVARVYDKLTSINNDKITRANGWILDLAEEMELRYLDSASVITDAEGWLPNSYQSGDGLHLTAEVYRKILDYIRTHEYR